MCHIMIIIFKLCALCKPLLVKVNAKDQRRKRGEVKPQGIGLSNRVRISDRLLMYSLAATDFQFFMI